MSVLLATRVLSRRALLQTVTKSQLVRKALISVGNGVKRKNIVFQAIDRKPGETLDEKNARLGRPMSPHLSVYRPQITSILSIIHRVTGAVLAVFLFTFAVGAFACDKKLEVCLKKGERYIREKELPEWLHMVPKAIVAFPFCYHLCNGVRHLLWDLGLFFSMPELTATGIIMLLCTFAMLGGTLYKGSKPEEAVEDAKKPAKK